MARPDFAAQVIDDVLALFPLNEAIMEQAEALEPHAAALLRERRAGSYPPITLPPIETIVERIRARGFRPGHPDPRLSRRLAEPSRWSSCPASPAPAKPA